MGGAGTFIHSARVVSAFALAGAVILGAVLGWIPTVAAAIVDVHAIGALVGGILGIVANKKRLV